MIEDWGVSANETSSHDPQFPIGPRRIAVIGAGISGLAAAHRLFELMGTLPHGTTAAGAVRHGVGHILGAMSCATVTQHRVNQDRSSDAAGVARGTDGDGRAAGGVTRGVTAFDLKRSDQSVQIFRKPRPVHPV